MLCSILKKYTPSGIRYSSCFIPVETVGIEYSKLEEWQHRPLEEIYPVLFIDAIHYSVRDNGVIRKLAAYVILGISCTGHKEVLTIQVGENESAKYWLCLILPT